ncbi:MAG TPA: DUF5818 domain-containing protein [Candidatus Acidoferrum sp.]|nr:DUF5818 domain-containing protein [Candidatus Acidoferrum sp.]
MTRTKRSIPILGSVLLAAASVLLTHASDEKVFKGYIADSQCAMNVHSLSQSHKEMLQSKSVGSTAADCVWYCVKQRGGRFVLQNKSKVYKLDDQNITKDMAAKKVRVTGTLDPQTNTIHVRTIEIEPDEQPRSDH